MGPYKKGFTPALFGPPREKIPNPFPKNPENALGGENFSHPREEIFLSRPEKRRLSPQNF